MAGEERKPATMSAAKTASTADGVRGKRPKPAAMDTVNQVSKRDCRPPATEAANFARRNSTKTPSRRLGFPAMPAASRLEP
eukprot:3787984-Lingulodinium_polyedra.AAC.1